MSSDAARGGDIFKLPMLPTSPPMLLSMLSARYLCVRCGLCKTAVANGLTCETIKLLIMTQ